MDRHGLPKRSFGLRQGHSSNATLTVQAQTIFTVPGAYTFTVPTGVTSLNVVAIGGGGGGMNAMGGGVLSTPVATEQ